MEFYFAFALAVVIVTAIGVSLYFAAQRGFRDE